MKLRRLAERRAFDLRVLSDMRCPTFDFRAYRTARDVRSAGPGITDPQSGAHVTNYLWVFSIRTHVSEDEFADEIKIRVFTDVPDYPRNPPGTEILPPHVPWSPHFRKNTPVCIGPELWQPRRGYIPLGALAIHIAHLLNWDEAGRGGGYTGYNEAAIRLHQEKYGGGPITPGLVYPALPGWLFGEPDAPNGDQEPDEPDEPDGTGFQVIP
jgi:hypothetical protein